MFPIEDNTCHVVFAVVQSNLTVSPCCADSRYPLAPKVVVVEPNRICWPAACVICQEVAPDNVISISVPVAAVAGNPNVRAPPAAMATYPYPGTMLATLVDTNCHWTPTDLRVTKPLASTPKEVESKCDTPLLTEAVDATAADRWISMVKELTAKESVRITLARICRGNGVCARECMGIDVYLVDCYASTSEI